uniref:Uncharacterized protein n=1 Tax=Rhizophagus irregularis (strain DAOM 181602 / DAOM 197198 / MUCL 43194) TaxID=747089 RepID=U9U187_RHIID
MGTVGETNERVVVLFDSFAVNTIVVNWIPGNGPFVRRAVQNFVRNNFGNII